MEMIHITEATPAGIPLIRNIAMAAWPAAYSRILPVAQLEYMIATFYNVAELQKQMREGVQFLLAYQGSTPVAFAGFGPQETNEIFKLYKLYVRPGMQQTGAGKTLLAAAKTRSKAAGAKRLILNVHRSNPARGFYEKYGFSIYETIDIPLGPGFVLNDYLMSCDL